ncbi:hypothetical protein BFR47_15895 [Oceanisphaera psychrotolerans]|uniref:Uncharacterized protein n=1 Tax=Oceanisphaera psychrotolerans TaxID=1414654 RepID=A0A1J4QCN8_9GAMM|nr:hypothetical protein BFR47_15895 [Oceanisphaera psychrotolerans]
MSVDAVGFQSYVVRSEIAFFKYIKTYELLLAILACILMVDAAIVIAEYRIYVMVRDGLVKKSGPVS